MGAWTLASTSEGRRTALEYITDPTMTDLQRVPALLDVHYYRCACMRQHLDLNLPCRSISLHHAGVDPLTHRMKKQSCIYIVMVVFPQCQRKTLYICSYCIVMLIKCSEEVCFCQLSCQTLRLQITAQDVRGAKPYTERHLPPWALWRCCAGDSASQYPLLLLLVHASEGDNRHDGHNLARKLLTCLEKATDLCSSFGHEKLEFQIPESWHAMYGRQQAIY